MSVSVLSGHPSQTTSGCASNAGQRAAANDGGIRNSSPKSPNLAVSNTPIRADSEPTSRETMTTDHHDHAQQPTTSKAQGISSPVDRGSRVAGRRYYSSSESECLAQGTNHGQNCRKRSRNQHNKQRGKKRKITATGMNNSHIKNVDSNYAKAIPRVPITNQPKAPNNTTEFLIADREERESSDRDLADTSDEEGLDDEDPEFNAIYDSATLERIEGLSRDQVNREMLSVNKSNSLLIDKIGHLKYENTRLKGILQQHGIEFSKYGDATGDKNPATLNKMLEEGFSQKAVESEREENKET